MRKANNTRFIKVTSEGISIAKEAFIGWESCHIAIADRNDPAWPENFLRTFLKNQSIIKIGTIDRNDKTGQIVMCLCTYASFRFGALA